MTENQHAKYLQYVRSARNPTEQQFDDDWEPIGPTLRFSLKPHYMVLRPNGRLYLTEAGEKVADGN